MPIDQILERMDLSTIHTIGCFFGVGLSLYVMQMNSHVDELLGYSKTGMFLSRLALGMIGISMMWAASYSHTKGWQPWPPDVLIVWAMDFALLMRSITIAIRWNRVVRHGEHDPFLMGLASIMRDEENHHSGSSIIRSKNR